MNNLMRRIARLKETVSPVVAVVSLVYSDGHKETIPKDRAFLAAVRSAEDSLRVVGFESQDNPESARTMTNALLCMCPIGFSVAELFADEMGGEA